MATTMELDGAIVDLIAHLTSLRRDICEKPQDPDTLEDELVTAKDNLIAVARAFRDMNDEEIANALEDESESS